jgi:hypothetical protein
MYRPVLYILMQYSACVGLRSYCDFIVISICMYPALMYSIARNLLVDSMWFIQCNLFVCIYYIRSIHMVDLPSRIFIKFLDSFIIIIHQHNNG